MSAAIVVFAACAAACGIAHVAILHSVVRKAGDGGNPGETGVPRSTLVVELIWAVIPIVVLAFVLTATWVHVRGRTAHPHPEPVMEVAR